MMSKLRFCLQPALRAGAGIAIVLSFGCFGNPVPEFAKVTGHVRYHGKPILQGTITMLSDAGQFDTASISDGEYAIARAPVGTVHVVLTGRTDRPKAEELEKKKWAQIKQGADRIKKLQAEGKSIDDIPPEPVVDDPQALPSKYAGDRSTPLIREVKSGNPVIDLDIED
jgi:hypothetical protein